MTPAEFAAMQAGLDPRAYYQDPYAAARAGLVDPESLPPRGATPIFSGIPSPPGPGVREQATEILGKGKQKLREGGVAAQDFLKKYGKYGTAAVGVASLVPGVTTALSELEAGRPTGALGALAPTALSAVGAGLLGKGGVAGTAAGLGLMGLGMLLPGATASGMEALKRKATGDPTTGKEDFANQLARARQIDDLGTTRFRNNMGVITSNAIDLQKAISDQSYSDLQRKLPIINQLNNAALVRQQALLNTQNQGYLQQGMLATAGALAQGAQAETGATVRTALTSNPYANATMQAPQIRFG